MTYGGNNEPRAGNVHGNQRGRKGKAANHVHENLSGVAIRSGQDRPDESMDTLHGMRNHDGKTDGQDVKQGVFTARLLCTTRVNAVRWFKAPSDASEGPRFRG